MPAPRFRSLLRRAALVLAGVALALALSEGAHRVWLALRGRPHDAQAVRAEFERTAGAAASAELRVPADRPQPDGGLEGGTELQRRFLHPYLGWEQRGTLLQLEALAERGARPAADFELWILGGSVAEMFAGQGTGALLRTLKADAFFAGRNVRIVSVARGGWKMPQPLYAAQWLFALGYQPHAIVALDGFNEVAIALDNVKRGTHPLYPSIAHWGTLAAAGAIDLESVRLLARADAARERAVRWCRRALDGGWQRSSVLSAVALARVRSAVADGRAAQAAHVARLSQLIGSPVLAGPPFQSGDDRAALADAVRGWSECARDLQALCDRRGIACLHVLQPTLHDPGAKRATPEELEKGAISEPWRVGVEIGYPLLRAAGAELAREGVAFADASRVFADVDATLYFDACHFGPDGQRILGAWVGERLLEQLR